MNKDAKIGLFAVLILVVLVAVMWAKLAGNRDEVAPVGEPGATEVVLNDAGTPGQGSETAIIRNPANPVTPAGTPAAGGYRQGEAPFENAGQPSANTDTPLGGDTANVSNMADGSGNTRGAGGQAELKDLFPGMNRRAGVDSFAADPAPPAGTAADTKEHVVAKGDSLAAIAKKYGVTWQAIAEANKAALPDPAKLKIGQKLQIPEPAPKVEPALKTDAGQETVRLDEPKTAPSTAAAGKTYTVKRGDTLISISRIAYGKAGLWKAILNANKDKLPSADKLRPGMVLVLPEKP